MILDTFYRTIYRIVILCVLTGLIIVVGSGCRSAPSFTQTHKLEDYGKSVIRDSMNIVLAPISWDKTDTTRFVTAFGSTATLTLVDKPIRKYAVEHHSRTGDKISAAVAPFGTINQIETAEAGVFSLTYIMGEYKIADTAFMALESSFVSHSIMGALKGITKRERPHATDNPYSFHSTESTFPSSITTKSFPSGDVTAAFSWASVVSERADNTAVDVISYGLAGLVAVRRVYVNAHWTSDVWAAALLGTCVGKAIVKYNSPNNQPKAAFIPIMNNNFIGAGIGFKF